MIALLYLSIFALTYMLKPDLPLWADIVVTVIWFTSVIFVNARWINMCERVDELENTVKDLTEKERRSQDQITVLNDEVLLLWNRREDEEN